MSPVLILNGVVWTAKTEAVDITGNDLDAEGSGRDAYTGEMFRIPVATKLKLEVAMLRLSETDVRSLATILKNPFVTAQFLNPETNVVESGEFYCSTRKYGMQHKLQPGGLTYYDGVSFTLTQK